MIVTTNDAMRQCECAGRVFRWTKPEERAGALAHAENFRQQLLKARDQRLGRELTFDEVRAGAALKGRVDDRDRKYNTFAPVLMPRPQADAAHPFDEWENSPAAEKLHKTPMEESLAAMRKRARDDYDKSQSPQVEVIDPHRQKAVEVAYTIYEAVAYDVKFPHSVLEAAKNLLTQARTQFSDVAITKAMATELTQCVREIEAAERRRIEGQLERTKLQVPDLELELAKHDVEQSKAEIELLEAEREQIREAARVSTEQELAALYAEIDQRRAERAR